jgi:hypothetical protein
MLVIGGACVQQSGPGVRVAERSAPAKPEKLSFTSESVESQMIKEYLMLRLETESLLAKRDGKVISSMEFEAGLERLRAHWVLVGKLAREVIRKYSVPVSSLDMLEQLLCLLGPRSAWAADPADLWSLPKDIANGVLIESETLKLGDEGQMRAWQEINSLYLMSDEEVKFVKAAIFTAGGVATLIIGGPTLIIVGGATTVFAGTLQMGATLSGNENLQKFADYAATVDGLINVFNILNPATGVDVLSTLDSWGTGWEVMGKEWAEFWDKEGRELREDIERDLAQRKEEKEIEAKIKEDKDRAQKELDDLLRARAEEEAKRA